jgi:hypothetical protein
MPTVRRPAAGRAGVSASPSTSRGQTHGRQCARSGRLPRSRRLPRADPRSERTFAQDINIPRPVASTTSSRRHHATGRSYQISRRHRIRQSRSSGGPGPSISPPCGRPRELWAACDRPFHRQAHRRTRRRWSNSGGGARGLESSRAAAGLISLEMVRRVVSCLAGVGRGRSRSGLRELFARRPYRPGHRPPSVFLESDFPGVVQQAARAGRGPQRQVSAAGTGTASPDNPLGGGRARQR